VICGVAAACFAAGHFTAFRSGVRIEHVAKGNTAGFAGDDGTSATSRSRSTGGSQKTAPIKSAEELRDVLAELEDSSDSEFSGMKKMMRLVERLEASNLAAIVRDYVKESLENTEGLEMVFGIMAEKDPEGAWKLAMTLPDDEKGEYLSQVITTLAAKSPDAALAKLDGVKDGDLRKELRQSVIEGMVESDPRRALLLVGNPPSDEDKYLLSKIFKKWVKSDAQAVQAAMQGMDGKMRTEAAGALANALAKTDPAAAWKLASDNAVPNGERNIIIRQWALTDPKAALEAASSLEKNWSRRNLMSNALSAWAKSDYNAALQHVLGSSNPDILSSGLSALAEVPGSDRPALFKAALERVPTGDQFQSVVSEVIGNWARENPREAAAAIDQLPLGSTHTNVVARIASQWFGKATDKNEPVNWALSMAEGEARTRALGSIFSRWSSSDPAAAAAAAMALPNEDRASVVQSIFHSLNQKDPQAALQWVSSLPDEKQRSEAIRRTLSNITDKNPQEAVTMLNSLGMGSNAAAVGTIVERWAGNDLSAAADWVKQLPNGEVRDGALGKVANRYAGDEPETAVAWAQAINDPKARTSALESVVKTWKRHDTQAAEAWVTTSNLPEDVKNRLFEK